MLNFTAPYAAVIASFIDSNANWTASPTALKNLGEKKFRITPVGAGPFKVVSNKLSSELVLTRNTTYWKPGKPYLDKLTFKSVGGDQAAYQALQAGQAQAYEGISTPQLVQQASKNPKLKVTQQKSTSPYFMQLNTTIPPFNNPKARQAIYYASDSEAIRSHIFNNMYVNTQGFTGPGGLFYEPTVPGYRTYNLDKAKQLVKELGGLKVTLGTINVLVAKETIQALQTQWQQAGMKVKIESYDLPGLIQAFQSKKWQAELQTAGSYDPAQGVGVAFRMSSMSPFSGIKDPKLDKMLGAGAGTLDEGQRKTDLRQHGQVHLRPGVRPVLLRLRAREHRGQGRHRAGPDHGDARGRRQPRRVLGRGLGERRLVLGESTRGGERGWTAARRRRAPRPRHRRAGSAAGRGARRRPPACLSRGCPRARA